MGNTFSYKAVVRLALTDPYLRIAAKEETEETGHTILGEGNLILLTINPHRDRTPARTRMDRHSFVSPQILPLDWRARSQTTVPSERAHTNIDDDLDAMENTFPAQVVVRNAIMAPYLHVAVKGETEKAGHTMLSEEYLILLTFYPDRESTPARTRTERHAAVSSQISSLG